MNADYFSSSFSIIAFAISIFIAAFLWLIWRKRQEKDFIIGPKELGATDKSLKQFYGWVPVILGVHVATALLINGIQGRLFFSHNQLVGYPSNLLGLGQILIALSFFYGGLTRLAALALGLFWLFGIFFLGIIPMLETIQYLGFASFFYFAGRGPYAIDRILFPRLEPNASYTSYALLFLRIGVGLNLIFLGFTGKFFAISLAIEGFVETLAILGGVLLTFGIFPRTVSLITLIFINALLTVSNWNSFIDYLPMYAALATFLVWEPNNVRQKLLWVEGLRKNMGDV